MERLRSIDALRGFAVVLMFAHHFFFLVEEPSESVIYALMLFISRFSAPLFLFIVGFCLVLSAQKRMEKQDKTEVMKHIVWRGLLLLASGFLLNVLIYHDLLDLNILHTIGLCVILVSSLSINPTPLRTITALAIIILLSSFSNAIPGLEFFRFPVIPWIIYTLFGVVAGKIMVGQAKNPKLKGQVLGLIVSGSMFLLLATAFAFFGFKFETSPASLTYIILSTAVVLFSTALFIKLDENIIINVLETYGTYAFLLYFTHYMFVVTLPKILGLEGAFNEIQAISCMLAFLLVSWLTLRYSRSIKSFFLEARRSTQPP